MIVAVLVVIWVIALTPFLLRRLSDRQMVSSAERFRAAVGLLRRIHPRIASEVSEGPILSEQAEVNPAIEAQRRRREAARLRKQRARRKAILFRLIGFTGGSIVLGALPHLHFLWDFSVAGAVLTTCYVSVLYYVAQKPAPLPAVRKPLVATGAYPGERVATRIAAAGGGNPFVVSPMAPRPAFRLVDPNA
jgi:hypothetical protein